MNWKKYYSYQAFDGFLQRFAMEGKSYVTKHDHVLNFDDAFEDIKTRFVVGYDESDDSFDSKVETQFAGASENTKIVFANIEYLWAMPVKNISPEKKRLYVRRWFSEQEVVIGSHLFFSDVHAIANPGSWHLTNKYYELVAIIRILNDVLRMGKYNSIEALKRRIESMSYKAIYEGVNAEEDFAVPYRCSSHSALLHLSNPDKYESIVSENHKKRICSVFDYVLDGETIKCREEKLRRIREKLYETHGVRTDPDRKYRWFFYMDDVKPLWIGKKTKRDQQAVSVLSEIREEELAEDIEGEKEEHTGYRIRRSGKLVLEAKKRDNFTCVACGFYYKKQIVQAHHLDPLSERKQPKKTKLEDLITLCPNCHYIAHYLLRQTSKYKKRAVLLRALQKFK